MPSKPARTVEEAFALFHAEDRAIAELVKIVAGDDLRAHLISLGYLEPKKPNAARPPTVKPVRWRP